MRMHLRILLAGLLVLAVAVSGSAATIGQWSGSSRTWNNSDFSAILGLMTSEGHIVTANQAINAGNLAAANVFLIGEPGAAPTGGEIALLSAYVSGGGILLMLADSGGSGATALNATAAGLGLGLSWSGSASSNPPLAGGNFATEGPPYNIVGQSLAVTPGTAVVAGGTALAGDYLRYETLGSGFVFGFADRSDHNAFSPSTGNVNGKLFLNIVNGPKQSVPEPSTVILLGAGLACLVAFRRRFVQD